MNLSGVIFPAMNAYPGVAYEIYLSGCYHNCKGCHSPELQDFDNGIPVNIKEIVSDIKSKINWVDIISILGGDMYCQDQKEAYYLMSALHREFPKLKFWLFTGAELEDLPEWYLGMFDVIKTGKYEEVLKQDWFPSSSNQKINYRGVDYERTAETCD